jgi:hypothetical protein
MKKCKKCNKEKPLDEFDKKRAVCKPCYSEYTKEYREKNKERIKEYIKEYQEKNKEKLKEYQKEYKREYREKNKERIKERYKERTKEYQKEYFKSCPLRRLRRSIRTSIGQSITHQGYTKKSRTYEILGCDFETFKKHIQMQFKKGMNWNNYGKWHLDHIYPVSLARDKKHLIELNHYTNFQPMWASENISKSNKIIEHQRKLAL